MSLHLLLRQVPVVQVDLQRSVDDDKHDHEKIDAGEERVESGGLFHAERQHHGEQKGDAEREHLLMRSEVVRRC